MLVLLGSYNPQSLANRAASSEARTILGTILALITLIAGQILWRPKLYAVVRSQRIALGIPPDCTVADAASAFQPSTIAATLPQILTKPCSQDFLLTASRDVVLAGGKARLTTSEWPIALSQCARHLMATLFDYTCPTCRKVHRIVNEAIERDPHPSRRVASFLPQNSKCNHTIKAVYPDHVLACQYARLALAVWQARPDQYEALSKYLIADKEIPPLGLAIRRAEELTGLRINPHQSDEKADRLQKLPRYTKH